MDISQKSNPPPRCIMANHYLDYISVLVSKGLRRPIRFQLPPPFIMDSSVQLDPPHLASRIYLTAHT